MAEPQVRYARTSDGLSIAYAQTGEGPDLLIVPFLYQTHILEMWSFPGFYGPRLAEVFRITIYDARGSGLSQRNVDDLGLPAMVRDLEAVVDAAGLHAFVLLSTWDGTPVAIRYAADNPQRVSHLVLADAWTSWSDYSATAAAAVDAALRGLDWHVYTETAGRVFAAFQGEGLGKRYAELMRASAAADVYWRAQEIMMDWDVSDALASIQAPTLVLHHKGNALLEIASGQRIAAAIPNARFTLADDPQYEGLASQVSGLMGIGDKPVASSHQLSAFRTILFTDLVGHTEMMSRLGDERGRTVLREHERITREVLKANGGTEVKTMGDGFMASFGSVTKSVECAVALQRAFAEREGEPLNVRVGLNAGEPIEEDGDLFGATVILASRIAAKAEGGEILVADTVRGLCSGKGFLFADRGEFVAKGFEEPVRVYEVRWGDG